MPANRVQKSSRNSTSRRRNLADFVATFGVQMSPCSRCSAKSLSCRVTARSDGCSECLSAGVSSACDAFGHSDAFLRSLLAEKRRLDSQHDEASKHFEQKVQELRQATARLDRIDKQRRRVEDRAFSAFGREAEVLQFQEAEESRGVDSNASAGLDWGSFLDSPPGSFSAAQLTADPLASPPAGGPS